MSKNKRTILDCHEAIDNYRWMLEDAISRGDKEEASLLRKELKQARNDMLDAKRCAGREKRNAKRMQNEIYLAMCAF